MANGMFGANTEVLREIAGRFGTQGDVTRDAGRTSMREVETVEWIGNDADRFRDDYRSAIHEALRQLALDLENKERELHRNANEQDQASGPGGGGGARRPAAPGFWDRMKSLFNAALSVFSDLRNPFRVIRFAMEAVAAIRNPSVFGKFFTLSWQGITGWRGGSKGIEALLEGMGRYGKFYKGIKWITDMMQAKPLAERFEGFVGKWADKIFKLNPGATVDKIKDWFGKSGRSFGRALGGLSVVMDGWAAINDIRNGDYGSAAWNGTKALLGAASFIPGPVGWAAAGISVGIAIAEIPAVQNAVTSAVSWAGNALSKLNPFG